jgi:ATP-dependent Zn protease
MIAENIESLHRIANALIEKENLSGAEVEAIMKNEVPAPEENEIVA